MRDFVESASGWDISKRRLSTSASVRPAGRSRCINYSKSANKRWMSLNAGAIKRPARPPRASHPFPISTQCVCLLSLSPVPTTRAEAFWTRLDAPKQINIRGTHISHVSLCFFLFALQSYYFFLRLCHAACTCASSRLLFYRIHIILINLGARTPLGVVQLERH